MTPSHVRDLATELLEGIGAALHEGAALESCREWMERRIRVAYIRAEVARRHEAKRGVERPASPPPRYDDVYFEGVAWLDRLARGEES